MFGMLLQPLVTTFAATCSKPTFLGLVPWYQYLKFEEQTVKTGSGVLKQCAITSFDPVSGNQTSVLGQNSAFLLIAMAILQDLIRISGLVAVGFVIYGGIMYMTSQGSPDQTKKAQQTIINALIGVAVALIAASIVAFIGNKLG